jgi:hypothetical protein
MYTSYLVIYIPYVFLIIGSKSPLTFHSVSTNIPLELYISCIIVCVMVRGIHSFYIIISSRIFMLETYEKLIFEHMCL